MDYNKKILRIFTEMPAFDDSQLKLGVQNQRDADVNTKRMQSLGKIYTTIKTNNLPNNMSIELLQNRERTCWVVYLKETINGVKKLAGELDLIESEFPFPAVQMSYVNKEYQGKGFSKLMYLTAISHLRGLVSDEKLTGEKMHGSFDTWASLGKNFYTYIIKSSHGVNDIQEVGNFDKSMMGSTASRFMVTVDEYTEQEF